MAAQEGPQTEEGSIVGTVAYMSPEQAEGQEGRCAFRYFYFRLGSLRDGHRAAGHLKAATKISTLSAILHKEPQPLGDFAPNLPAELEKIISRCLRKDPERRAQHIGDIKLALEELREDSESGKLSSASKAGSRAPARSIASSSRRS